MKPDGPYVFEDIQNELSHDFRSESELCDFIEDNIQVFCLDELGVIYASHKREHPVVKSRKRIKGLRRLDFLIKTRAGENIGLECKVPLYPSGLPAGIGQILSYRILMDLAGTPINRFVLVSSKMDIVVPMMIQAFELPIEFIAMDKKRSLTWQGR